MPQNHSFLTKNFRGSAPTPARVLSLNCRKMLQKNSFCQKFPGALPPTPARVLSIDCWKKLQKHSFWLKSFGGSAPSLHQGFTSRSLENASKSIIFVKNFRGSARGSRLLGNVAKSLILSKISVGSAPIPAKVLFPDCWKMLQKHSFLTKISGAPPKPPQGFSKLLENASKELIFVKNFRELCPQPQQGFCL